MLPWNAVKITYLEFDKQLLKRIITDADKKLFFAGHLKVNAKDKNKLLAQINMILALFLRWQQRHLMPICNVLSKDEGFLIDIVWNEEMQIYKIVRLLHDI